MAIELLYKTLHYTTVKERFVKICLYSFGNPIRHLQECVAADTKVVDWFVLDNNGHPEKNSLFLKFIIDPQSWSAYSHIDLREFLNKRKRAKKGKGTFIGLLAYVRCFSNHKIKFYLIIKRILPMLLQFLRWWKCKLKALQS